MERCGQHPRRPVGRSRSRALPWPPSPLVLASGGLDTLRIARTSLALFLFWCVLVVPEGATDVVVGVTLSWALGLWSARFLWPEGASYAGSLRPMRAFVFALVIALRVVVAAAQVLRIVLDPRLRIDPAVFVRSVRFDQEAARVAYANAITITPGTLTLDVDHDTFVVHTLDPRLAGDVVDGTLERDVARLFERRGAA